MPISSTRAALLPAPWLPLAYFAGAHVALAAAWGLLLAVPDLPGAFHYHPRSIAVVHLITLGWISGSILGAFYIVAPLAFGLPFPARAADAWACASFQCGAAGMVIGFWRADYRLVGLASLLVLGTLSFVGVRAIAGLRAARLPTGVSLHVGFAFLNVLGAGSFGLVAAYGKATGALAWSPLAVAAAHAHLAVIGWGVMMIVGVSYRLVPMFLPAAMPVGRALVWSAVLLEGGTLGIAYALLTRRAPWLAVIVLVAGLGVFMREVRGILGSRRPRPAAMVGRDWSTWQTHVAMLYLPVALGTGMLTSLNGSFATTWVYGVTGIVGFVAQMVVGIQGRLLPLHAWYGAMRALDGEPPAQTAHRLAEPRLALAIFLLWLAAVPVLAAGLARQNTGAISLAAALLLISTLLQAAQLVVMVRRARTA